MAEIDDNALAAFLKKLDWNALVGDPEIKSLALQIKKRADGMLGTDNVDIANATRIKLVVVGDGAVGKTSLLISYATGDFPTEYVPTVFENYTAQLELEGETILMHLWDTAGQEDYDRLRPLSYPGSDIVFLCFSVVHRPSYDAIKIKWYPEVHHYVASVPIILLGTKLDLREACEADANLAKGFSLVSTAEGEKLAKEIGAVKYVEVSAKTRKGLDAVFQDAVNTVLEIRGAQDKPGAPASPVVQSHLATTKKNTNKKQGCMLL